MGAVSLEVKNCIHHVFQHFGTGNGTVFGDMTDKKNQECRISWKKRISRDEDSRTCPTLPGADMSSPE